MHRILLIFLCLAAQAAVAGTPVPFDSPRWKFYGKTTVPEIRMGKNALRLNQGSAVLADANFTNGTISFDISIRQARYFPSIRFRIQGQDDFEEFYIRPHQSGNPDAMQYMPVYHGLGGWQLYYGPGFTNAAPLPFDRWLHVTIVVNDRQAEVFFDDHPEPVLFISKLKRSPAAGMIALTNLAPEDAWYANVSVTPENGLPIKSKPLPISPLPAGTIAGWEVSSPFPEKLLASETRLSSALHAMLSWEKLAADEMGIADLSILHGITKDTNTVFVKTVIHADRDTVRKFAFGFSDRARLFLNGKLLYAGADNFMSRDYRFLGTIGYFDAVWLDLKKGQNEVWIAVSEDFGGWGVKARLE
ncbi:hypothetical protein ACQKLP_16990 [Chitinophaga sp. NPDC101104]|uniref:hypothetical protein n=1 Tax=Chitinophaga sp. NPDC101104 TaxID=3390561 RepID=UPI003CFE7B55